MRDPASLPLHLGVIGCGRVFERFHLPAIARVPTISLLAGCDTNRSRLAWAEHWSSPPALFGTPAELLGCPGLEAVNYLRLMRRHATAREWLGFLAVLPLRAAQLMAAQVKGVAL